MAEDYYSKIASGYDELYGEEQQGKFDVVKKHVCLRPLVLDIGCGTGVVDMGVRSVGVDPSFGLLRRRKGLRVCARAEALPFKDKTFNSIVSLTALHHADIDKAVREIGRVARPGAVFAITVLKKAKDFQEIVSKLRSGFGLDEVYHEKDVVLVKHRE